MDYLIVSESSIAGYIYAKKKTKNLLQPPKSIYVSHLVLILMTFRLFSGK